MTPTNWRDVRPGTVLTVKHLHRTRPFRLRVSKVDPVSSRGGYAFVSGERLRMDGSRSLLKHTKGIRKELVYLGDITALEAPPERRKFNADGRRARGTSNGNQRGGSDARRARKLWLLKEFGDGEKAPCAFQCGTMVGLDTISVDRIIPGAQGGTYARGNIRPVCRRCNSSHGARVRRA